MFDFQSSEGTHKELEVQELMDPLSSLMSPPHHQTSPQLAGSDETNQRVWMAFSELRRDLRTSDQELGTRIESGVLLQVQELMDPRSTLG